MKCLENAGFSAFSIEGAQEPGKAESLVDWGVKMGLRHPQFAIGLMTDSTAQAVFQRCDDSGALASSLVFLGPEHCPTIDPKGAIEALKPQLARALLMAPMKCRVVGPLFRALGDPKRGLAATDDRAKQIDFLTQLVALVNQYPTMEFGLEIINRFESRGPNEQEEAFDLLAAVPGGERLLYLPDNCHTVMGEANPEKAWIELAAKSAMFHLSPFGRQQLSKGEAICKFMVQVAFASGKPVVMELFGNNTPEGFFDLLCVHQKGDVDCQTLFMQGLRYIKQLLGVEE